MKLIPKGKLLAITGAAVLIHGYHLGTDDAAIYVPGIKRAASPELYPFGSEFFLSHAHLSVFSTLVGGFARLTHLSSDAAILACHFVGMFLLVLAAWKLACACTKSAAARWGAVGLIAAVCPVPVAGTALFIMDPYVTARSLSAPASLLAVAAFASGAWLQAIAWLLFTALVHPQMAVYAVALLAGMALARARMPKLESVPALAAALPFLWPLAPAAGPAREALFSRTYFFLYNWAWYEWLGVIGPLALLWCFARGGFRGMNPVFTVLARSCFWFGALATGAGLVLSSSARLENYTRLQPMRAFHLIYMVLFVLLGALAGEYLLKRRVWRWFALFVPLAAGMFVWASQSYAFSPHIEWPGATAQNPWLQAFYWIRHNTPESAVFALDPGYMAIPEEDQHGFRAVAERSMLADAVKDSGAVSLFPNLAETWKAQVTAESGWNRFQPADFERLARADPVTWVVVRNGSTAGLNCPYKNGAVAVCRIAGASPDR